MYWGVRAAAAVAICLLVVSGGALALGVADLDGQGAGEPVSGSVTPSPDRTQVVALDANASRVATIDVRVADSAVERYQGLSDTESLGSDEGMLFVHDSEGEYAYVMRDMSFSIDIVFVDANGTITSIHHAENPPEGVTGNELTQYRGEGKYVLELPYGYTNRTGMEVGGRVEIDDY